MRLSQIQGGEFDEIITDSGRRRLIQIQGGEFDEIITDSGRRIR